MQTTNDLATRHFDLNYEDVLEHWSMAHAVREIIANALDEQVLTQTTEPQIIKDETGAWHVRDLGRGLRYEHLTQNENKEKQQHAEQIIGKFGIGLKDALATADRHNVAILVRSKYGDITIGRTNKHGFSDIVTLHANIAAPSNSEIIGTDFVLSGVSDQDIYTAKDWFLLYSGDRQLEKTKFGTVLARKGSAGRIYVNGLCVAEEENFLFSYNITSLTPKLLKALNRERTNVGRTAYTDRVKSILLACTSPEVQNTLADELAGFESGKMHDELLWQEVSQYASRILNAKEKVIFVTPSQLLAGGSTIMHAQLDGYRVVTVSENIADKMPATDINNRPMLDVTQYLAEWNTSFEYKLVSPETLSISEKAVYALTQTILQLAGKERTQNIKNILISETMRLESYRSHEAVGVWEASESRIIIKRSELASATSYTATLLHEITHSFTNSDDLTQEFENGLTELLGVLGSKALGCLSRVTN